jgi:hypothetical protein
MNLINKIGDVLYGNIDKFFQGKVNLPSQELSVKHTQTDIHCMTWELNQGVEDIVIKDLKISLKILIPGIISRRIERVYRKACMYFLVDAAIEEGSLDPGKQPESKMELSAPPASKQIFVINSLKMCANQHILALIDWLKIKLQRIRPGIRQPGHDKPYYLLGDFSPLRFELYSGHIKFRKACIFHLRN